MNEVKSENPVHSVKLAARNEVLKEKFEKAKKELFNLYKKRDDAMKVVKNCDREIADYEMELEEDTKN